MTTSAINLFVTRQAGITAAIAVAVTLLSSRSAAQKRGIPLRRNLSFWQEFVFQTLRYVICAFGALSILAILLQRWVGTVEVDHLGAIIICGIYFAESLGTATSTMLSMTRDEDGTLLAYGSGCTSETSLRSWLECW